MHTPRTQLLHSNYHEQFWLCPSNKFKQERRLCGKSEGQVQSTKQRHAGHRGLERGGSRPRESW